MRKGSLFLVLGAALVLGVVLGSVQDAAATCYQQFVRTECPSGKISSSIVPSDAAKVDTSTQVCGHALTSNVCPTAAEVNAVAPSRQVCGHALSADVCPTYAEVGADASGAAAAVQSNLDAFIATKGAPSGICPLDSTSLVPWTNLPFNSATYVPWTYVEGTGTATSTATDKIVNAADPRLSDARTPTGNIYGDGNVAWKTGTSTSTATSAALSAAPVAALVNVPDTLLTMGTGTHANVSTTGHGLTPTLPNDASKFLDGTGAWSAPSASVGWSNGYEVDFSTLTNQNLLTGGDGQKTLSDSHTLYLFNSAKLATAAIQNGTGLYLSGALATSSSYGMTAATVYWRFEEQGTGNLAKHRWGRARAIFILTHMPTPAATVHYDLVGGWLGNTSGVADLTTNGKTTFTPATSSTVRAQTDFGFVGGVLKEGIFSYGQLGSNSAARSSDTGSALVGGTPKDMTVWETAGARMTVSIGNSNSGAFPADIDGAVVPVGSTLSVLTSAADLTSTAAFVTLSTSGSVTGYELTIKKLRIEYQ